MWSQKDLAQSAGISPVTLNKFERGTSLLSAPNAATLKELFVNAGIEFPDPHGVRLRTEGVKILQGEEAMKILWDDIFNTLKDVGGEILITHVDEQRTLVQEAEALTSHIKRLKKHGITERLLSCEGDDFFLMPKKCYRWLEARHFHTSLSTYTYQDKVAIQMWDTSIIVLLQHKDAAQAERARFENLWTNAKIPE